MKGFLFYMVLGGLSPLAPMVLHCGSVESLPFLGALHRKMEGFFVRCGQAGVSFLLTSNLWMCICTLNPNYFFIDLSLVSDQEQ